MSQTFRRNRSTWMAYLMLAAFDYFLNVFGPITPFLKNELALSYTVSSLHFSAFALGMMLAGLLGNRAIQRLGCWQALSLGTFGLCLSALLLIVGRVPALTIGASFLMGLLGSLITSVVTSALSDQYGDLRAIAYSEANLISSLVGAAAPVLVGWFALTFLGWRAGLAIGAIAAIVVRLGSDKHHFPQTETAETGADSHQPLSALYWIYWITLVMAISIEFCMLSWSADYMETILKLPKASAAQAVSLLLIGMLVGRLTTSRLVQRFKSYPIMTVSLLIAAAGFLVYWTAATALAGEIGLLLTGLGIACLYPLVLALTMETAGSSVIRASALASLAAGAAISRCRWSSGDWPTRSASARPTASSSC